MARTRGRRPVDGKDPKDQLETVHWRLGRVVWPKVAFWTRHEIDDIDIEHLTETITGYERLHDICSAHIRFLLSEADQSR